MRLFIDIGNTLSKFGLEENGNFLEVLSWPTSELYKYKIDKTIFENVDSAYISSVVPKASEVMNELLLQNNIKNIRYIGPKDKTPIEIDIENPDELGTDLLCDLVGGHVKYGAPLLIIDLGTASKVLLLNKNGMFQHCVIIPGLKLGFTSLCDNAALLNNRIIEKAKKYTDCHNTKDVISTSIIYSHADSINGAVRRFEKEIGYKCKRILTGGYSKYIKNYLDFNFVEEPNLALTGLKEIIDYEEN